VIDSRTVPVRFSRLKNMSRSPAHYLHSLTAEYDSKAMRLGRLTHHLVFGTSGYVVFPGGARRGKTWDAFAADHSGLDIYTMDEYTVAQQMAQAVLADDNARNLLLRCDVREKTHTWTIMGRQCQGTPDAHGPGVLLDLKTTRCAEPEWFKREALRSRYIEQLAWYGDAIEQVEGWRPHESYIIAVENTAPYAVTVLKLTDRALEQGRKLNRLWFERLLSCEAANEWPGYVQSVVDLDVPDPDEEFSLTFGDEEDEDEAA
jgi:hypothetical protein